MSISGGKGSLFSTQLQLYVLEKAFKDIVEKGEYATIIFFPRNVLYPPGTEITFCASLYPHKRSFEGYTGVTLSVCPIVHHEILSIP